MLESALRRVIDDLVPARPFLVVCHDAQWIDAMTWEVLAVALRAAVTHLVVVEARPSSVAAGTELGAWCEVEQAVRLDVRGLDRAEVAALVCDRLDVDVVPDATIDVVHEHSAGNPFFIEQSSTPPSKQATSSSSAGTCGSPQDGG